MNDTFTTLDLAKYNGTITLYNPTTGQHRTIRIKTQKADANFAPGMRIISLLNGPDNTSDYRGFGFVTDDGTIKVWMKCKGKNGERSAYEKLANMLTNWEHFQSTHGIEYKFSVRCRVCNRKLTDPVSIDLGIGPICGGR